MMNNDWKPTENNIPNIFQPTPQTPEQVVEGLRNAFKQAIQDGVLDSTPYLKQMTFNSDIEKTEAEIKVLQKKLELLKEIETHKSQPKMHLENEGEFNIVSFKGDIFYRLQFPDGICCWYMKTEDDYNHYKVSLEFVDDMKSKHQLESVWKNEVLIQKNTEPYCPDEPEYYDEVEWDEKDNPKSMDEVVDKMLKEWEENPPEFLKFEMGKTLEQIITRWWKDIHEVHTDWRTETAIDDLIDQIQFWLPKEQSHEGTQNASVIDLVDGFNDALTKIKSKLRNKK